MKDQPNAETVKFNEQPHQSYRLSYAFKQQLMKSWRPKPTLKCAITVYVIIGLIFFALGIAMLVKTNEIFELQQRYDNTCAVDRANPNGYCTVTFTLAEKVTAPVYFFYRVTNFYQNHRRYVQSIDINQLSAGVYVSNQTYSNCEPVTKNKHLFSTMQSMSGKPLDPEAQAFPCGLVARSLFNDTFDLSYNSGGSATPYALEEKGIAWPDDINYRYKNINGSYQDYQWTNVESERFMTWMKMSPFMDFRKTWGIIRQDMPAGTYTLRIQSRWDSSIFQGEKWFVLSQTNAFGGKNYFLSYSYLAIGGLAILLAILFIIRKMTRPKGMLDKKLREYA